MKRSGSATRENTKSLGLDTAGEDGPPSQRAAPADRRANDLDGATWTRNSISVWNDIRKTPEEIRWNHPAMFPTALVDRLIDCFTTARDEYVLDPFMGSGSTVLAADRRQKTGIGLEISARYIELARKRLAQSSLFGERKKHQLIQDDAKNLLTHVAPDTLDLCITSPPYWDILSQKRTADYKAIRDYDNTGGDLSKISGYQEFLNALAGVFSLVLQALKPGKYCVVNVMDLRKKEVFFPFHADLARKLQESGWIYDDVIIWDRHSEYNNLRPLGYPFVFRINKIHEYLLLFRKPPGT